MTRNPILTGRSDERMRHFYHPSVEEEQEEQEEQHT